MGVTSKRDIILSTIFILFGTLWFFREFIFSNFNNISGDIGDFRFVIFLNEHLFQSFFYKGDFFNPNFFFPEKNILSFSDAFLIYSVFYSIFRFIGFDIFIAYELTLIIIFIIGYIFCYLLLNKYLHIQKYISLIMALVFTFSNAHYLTIGHSQLLSILFFPLIIILMIESMNHIKLQSERFNYWAVVFGFVFTALLNTSFYIGWFIFLIICICLLLLSVVFSEKTYFFLYTARSFTLRAAFAASVGCLPMLSLFLYLYVPTLLKGFRREYSDSIPYLGQPIDWINLGNNNLIWDWLIRSLPNYPLHRLLNPEAFLAPTPMLLIISLISIILWIINFRKHDPRITIAGICGIVTWVALICVTRFGDWSLWKLIWNIIPGASAIRAPFRFALAANFMAIITTAVFLTILAKKSQRGLIVAYIIAGFIILEQIQLTPNAFIDRTAELTRLKNIPAPPNTCKVFFVAHKSEPQRYAFAQQIDAMLISQQIHLPTINGYSGWVPKDWAAADPDSSEYTENVRNWLIKNNILDGACSYDVSVKKWNPTPFVVTIPSWNEKIDFTKTGSGTQYRKQGWSVPEDGGVWTIGEHASLHFSIPPTSSSVEIISDAMPFLSPQHESISVDVIVNDQLIKTWTYDTGYWQSHIRYAIVPADIIQNSYLNIQLRIRYPASPSEFGLSQDNRKLGIFLKSLEFTTK